HRGARDAHRVAFLERVLADRLGGHLPRDHHQRDRVHVRRGDAGHRVGDARAARDESDARLAGGARVTVGRMQRALLVPREDVLEVALLPRERVVDVQYRPARIAEYELDALFLQAADDDFGARQGFAGFREGRELEFHAKTL